MEQDDLDYIMFTIKQAKEAAAFGFTYNNCRRNLQNVLRPYIKGNFSLARIADYLMDGALEKEFVEKTLTEERLAEISAGTSNERKDANSSKSHFEFIAFALEQVKQAREKFPHRSQTENFNIAMVQHWEKGKMEENEQKKDTLTIKSLEAVAKMDMVGDCRATRAIPKGVMINCLLGKLPDKNKVESFLVENHYVVLVSIEEHKKLRKAGLQQKMPEGWECGDDPWARLKAVGIELVEGYPVC